MADERPVVEMIGAEVSVHENRGYFEIHLFGERVGSLFGDGTEARTTAVWLTVAWKEIHRLASERVTNATPPLIAADLKTPPPGAVEGAEIVSHAPDYRGFIEAWRRRIEGERSGQAAFNLLREVRPDLAESVRGVEGLDPFYLDKNLPMFWAWLSRVLDGKS